MFKKPKVRKFQQFDKRKFWWLFSNSRNDHFVKKIFLQVSENVRNSSNTLQRSATIFRYACFLEVLAALINYTFCRNATNSQIGWLEHLRCHSS
ncbi:hypothetical protein L596_004749 [Steinernema carpocapsae]|uniref:Uncharacterized protein n=1 Tax=Steinernema carpocapsae TaxID=34508 RepID=A0A4U8UWR3_STECR|nr:hypothetical protein L596_004749 [Steinernema carpocapsae]